MPYKFSAKSAHEKDATPAQSKGLTPKYEFEGHEGTIWSFGFLHDNVHIVSGSLDGTMRKWDCHTGLIVGEPWKGEGGSIYSLMLSPDGKTIACGRKDGSVQRWTTDGEMIKGVWAGHSDRVRSLSWSPSGDHLASGSGDGTILIRKAESGEIAVSPINTEQIGVWSLAYSPSGGRIASGGWNKTICIWHTKTGKLVVGPIEDVGNSTVTSLTWSSDSSKLYSASDKFSRVFDSTSGQLIHRFQHEHSLYDVALSPKNNALACVGIEGVARLWDTESHQLLGQLFYQDHADFYCVLFSRDGRYLACGGRDGTIALWMVKDIAPELAEPIFQKGHGRPTQQETQARPKSPSSSWLDADATGGDDILEVCDDPYHNFFESSKTSLPSPSSGSHPPHLPSIRRFWNVISRHRPLADEPVPRERHKRGFFGRRARSKSPLGPATVIHNQLPPDGKVQVGDEGEEDAKDDPELDASKDIQQEESFADAQSPPPAVTTSHSKLDSDDHNLWKRLMRTRRKDPTSTKIAPALKRPEVVDVYAVRGFQRYVAQTPKPKTKSSVAMHSAPLTASHARGSLPGGPSSHVSPVQLGMSLQTTSRQGRPSPVIVGHRTHYSQAVGGHASPSHFVTTYHASRDSDSDSIQGSCNKFLDKICFPCGHYHEDS
ncbi:WD40-repeat-containing domain protein [Suillus clintonianus]|uniref:WD40-repeat-containing domain protein n=1 Tax=Suillus clintonianus TaxID=1904413 RepID=UPI001B86A67B|nr:WD40-repeat-containing domain protein [Suillus clintonianus]KAG2121088.1 WD40-repeat-containing domain protein [Suillus clintonianus]